MDENFSLEDNVYKRAQLPVIQGAGMGMTSLEDIAIAARLAAIYDVKNELNETNPNFNQLIIDNNNNHRASTNSIIVDFHNALSKVPIINNIAIDIHSIVPTYNKTRQSQILNYFKLKRIEEYEVTLTDAKMKAAYFTCKNPDSSTWFTKKPTGFYNSLNNFQFQVLIAQRLHTSIPSVADQSKCTCGFAYDLNSPEGTRHLGICKKEGLVIAAHNNFNVKLCQINKVYAVPAKISTVSDNNRFKVVDQHTNQNYDILVSKGSIDYQKETAIDSQVLDPQVGATTNNASRNEATVLSNGEKYKQNKYERYFNHPLLRNILKLVAFTVTNYGTYGKEAEKYIKTLAKHASNITNISPTVLEQYIKRSLSFTIHQSWANTVINHLIRLNHKFVDPTIRHEFSNEYIINQSIDSHKTNHHNPNHHFFNNDRNSDIDRSHLINGNRMETTFRNYRFTVNLNTVETLD